MTGQVSALRNDCMKKKSNSRRQYLETKDVCVSIKTERVQDDDHDGVLTMVGQERNLVDGIWSAVGMTAAQSGDLHTGA
jgi:hypothetical protein